MRRFPRLSRAVQRVRGALAALFPVEQDVTDVVPMRPALTTTTTVRPPARRAMNISDDSVIPPERQRGPHDMIEAFRPAQPAPGIVPGLAHDAEMAMDDFTGAAINWAGFDALDEGLTFMGFPYLAQLTQRPEYRKPSEILAKEMTRRWIRVQATGDEDKTEIVNKITDELKRLNAQDIFQKAAEQDGCFGRAQIFIDVGQTDPGELAMPLHVSKRKIIRGSLKALKVIEPIWSYPDTYNSNNPLADDFYKPTSWFIFAQRVHASRLMTLVSRDVPDILKPAYAFGGLSLSQMAKPYIDNWLRTRQSVSDSIHNFSVSVLKTNMGSVLNAGGVRQMLLRAQVFNQARDNRGLMMVDKETEDFANITTPLGGLDRLQAQSQEQMSAVTGIPLVILLGITPSGLNASSEGELAAFYAWVEAQQRTLFGPPLKKLIDIIQLSLFGEIDPSITFMFEPLQVLDDTERAAVEKTKMDTDVAAIGAGIIDPLEARTRLASDEDGPYASLDLAKTITPPGGMEGQGGDPFGGEPDEDDPTDPNGGPGGAPNADPNATPKPTPGAIKPVAASPDNAPNAPQGAADADWREGDHPRANNGQFGSGSGSAAPAPAPAAHEHPPLSPEDKAIEQRLADKIKADPAAAEAEYNKLKDAEGGKVLNTDTARELSPDYMADRTKAAAVHEPASDLVKMLYAKKLAEAPGPGEEPLVLFTAGGGGSGKSSAINGLDSLAQLKQKSQIIFDTTMSGYGSAKKKIDQALAAGKTVAIVMVARDPHDALVNGVLPRAENQRMQFGSGRTVPLDEFLDAHKGALETVKKLSKTYADNPDVNITIVDNSLGRGKQQERDLDWLHAQEYNDLAPRAIAALENEYDNGRISHETYRGVAGRHARPDARAQGQHDAPAGNGSPDRRAAEEGGPVGGRGPSQAHDGVIHSDRAARRDGAGGAHPLANDEALKAAGIMFRAADGSVLLLKRGAGGQYAGTWCFPGGKVEPGESRKEAARREANEEIGEHPENTLQEIDRSPEGSSVDFTTFLQDVSKPFVPTLNHEHTAWAWARPDSLPEPMHPGPLATLTGQHVDADAAQAA